MTKRRRRTRTYYVRSVVINLLLADLNLHDLLAETDLWWRVVSGALMTGLAIMAMIDLNLAIQPSSETNRGG